MASLVAAKVVAVSLSLIAAGGIFAQSLFSIPQLRAQPASRSLPSLRWLFSRGSHIFPQAAVLSSLCFASLAYHAYRALPAVTSAASIMRALLDSRAGWAVLGYALAATLTLSIAPFTSLAMLATNFELIQANVSLGGSRSQASAADRSSHTPPQRAAIDQRSAADSVAGKGEGPNELTDLSGPQAKAPREASAGEEARVRELLDRFGWLNAMRGVLLGAGGMVGLCVALTEG